MGGVGLVVGLVKFLRRGSAYSYELANMSVTNDRPPVCFCFFIVLVFVVWVFGVWVQPGSSVLCHVYLDER